MGSARMAGDSGVIVTLDGVSKRYWNVQALDRVSFDILRSEIFGYIGPNGAGKTTTIKAMVGLLRDFEGAIAIDDHSIRERTGEVQKHLGYLPQKAAFQDWRTVDQALTTFGRLSGLSKQAVDTRIPEVLELVGIPETRERKIVHLSGGTVQKLGMAQAILHRPDLLVLDEPMAGLDPASRYQFKAIFKELRKEGTTIFFSSHILSDVQDVADRIGILNRGRIAHVGTLAELRARLHVPKDVDIVLSHDSKRALDAAALAGVAAVEQVGPGRLLAHVKPEADLDEAITALIDGLRRAGYGIRNIGPVNPDLEELYVRFVSGGYGA
jgi:ABC-2 type transport system ATP-binding protein